jgi:Fic family protein
MCFGGVMFTAANQMEPMAVSGDHRELSDLAIDIIRKSASLSNIINPHSQLAIVSLVRTMNCYYSNLIEGHNTHPLDIDRALEGQYSKDPAKRALQQESKAHIATQLAIEERIRSDPDLVITNVEYLQWIHKTFYEQLPVELYRITDVHENVIDNVVPGEFRSRNVKVGHHIPPQAENLHAFMARFHQAYQTSNKNDLQRVILSGPAHHRLAWIHPFLDGNGRVTRLFSDSYFRICHVDGYGLWTISRGLARHRKIYFSNLEVADKPRQGDLDGRGNLSESSLLEFSIFFLRCAIDQIDFMSSVLNLDQLKLRIESYCNYQSNLGKLRPESSIIISEALVHGEIARGAVASLINKSERTSRRIIKELTSRGLLQSKTEKSPLRFAVPTEVVGYYFPDLYPSNLGLI